MTTPYSPSAEIRWFLPEQGQWDAMLQWFLGNGELALLAETAPYVRQADAAPFVKQELPRADEYLLLPNCEKVGVKLHQGRLEVKGWQRGRGHLPRTALPAVSMNG